MYMKKFIEKLKIAGEETIEDYSPKQFLLILLVAILGLSIYVMAFSIFFGNRAITHILASISCIISYRYIVGKDSFKNIIKKLFKWKTWVYGLMFGLILTIFNFSASQLVEFLTNDISSNESSVRSMLLEEPFLAGCYVILLAPFIEEFGYRVGVFGYTKKYGKVIAYILSGLLFGLLHLAGSIGSDINIATELLSLVVYSLCGLILCFAYDTTNSLCVSTLAHMISNIVAVLLLF